VYIQSARCCCGEIRKVLKFLIKRYCPKACHKPDHSIRIVEYHRKDYLESLNPTSSPRLEPRAVFGYVTIVPVIFSRKQANLCLFSELQKSSSSGIEPRTVFRDCNLCSSNIPAETNNFCLGAALISCKFSKLQKTSSMGMEHRAGIRGSGLCFRNLLFETKNFGFFVVLLSCLVSELQEPPSPELEIGTHFSGVLASLKSLSGLK
jgi:hypothetical protein